MLQAKTEEQKRYIESILKKDDTCAEWGIDIDSEYENCLFIDDCITFDTMAEIVDYLRSVNKSKKSQLDMSIVAPNMLEPVETWLAYKKEKGQTYKPTGFKTFYNNLIKLSDNNPMLAMRIVEKSMQNNYAGIFALRDWEKETILRDLPTQQQDMPTNNDMVINGQIYR